MTRGKRGTEVRTLTLLVLASVTAVIAVIASACGAAGPAGLLVGTVTLGPIMPVERIGGPPGTRPFAASIAIETPDGGAVRTVRSGDGGGFSVRLAAGRYRLVPQSPPGRPYPRAAPLGVVVAADRTTTVRVAYDSGIR